MLTLSSSFFTQILLAFPIPPPGSLSKEENDQRLQRDFEPLVAELLDKFQNGSAKRKREGQLKLPGTAEEVRRMFSVVHPLASISKDEGRSTFFLFT